jgi:hypothetical protein
MRCATVGIMWGLIRKIEKKELRRRRQPRGGALGRRGERCGPTCVAGAGAPPELPGPKQVRQTLGPSMPEPMRKLQKANSRNLLGRALSLWAESPVRELCEGRPGRAGLSWGSPAGGHCRQGATYPEVCFCERMLLVRQDTAEPSLTAG